MIPRACDDDRCDYDTAGWAHDPGCRYSRGLHGDGDMAAATAQEDGYSRAYGTAPQARAVRKRRPLTPLAIAHVRAEHSADPDAFMHGFGLAATADDRGPDIELLVSAALRAEDYPTIAGLIEGLAAVRADADWPLHAKAIYPRFPNLRQHRMEVAA